MRVDVLADAPVPHVRTHETPQGARLQIGRVDDEARVGGQALDRGTAIEVLCIGLRQVFVHGPRQDDVFDQLQGAAEALTGERHRAARR
jgi:hypothetical protein